MSTRARISLISIGAFVALALPVGASAAVITVNSTGDTQANDNTCTLREAIIAANTNTASGAQPNECAAGGTTKDTIQFSALFNGNHPTSTIVAGSFLPPITTKMDIVGGTCAPGGPCVGVQESGDSAFFVDAGDVHISGVAITGASVGVFGTQNAGAMKVTGSWFGIRVNQGQSSASNDVGLAVAANNAQIGGTTAADRNVFAQSDDSAVQVQSGDGAVIEGNYFGTLPNGDTPALAQTPTDILVIAESGNPLGAPIGTVIGGPDTGTPSLCDGACNVMANYSLHAIDLQGDGFSEGPAGQTSILGNMVGLDKDGTTDLSLGGSTGEAVLVGDADNVTIGGAAAADRNYVLDEITFGVGAGSPTVQNNFLGLNANGSQRLGSGGWVDSSTAGLSVLDNRIAAEESGGVLIAILLGDSSTVRGNTLGIGTGGQDVGGGDTVLRTNGSNNVIGGSAPGQGNVFANGNTGLVLAGSDNTAIGNKVGTNADETVDNPITNSPVVINGGSDQTIGGTTAASENALVSQNSGLILIIGDGSDRNSVLRNHGHSISQGRFLDLVPGFGAGNDPSTGANDGIQAPSVTLGATPDLISGTGAEPGATVRVYVTDSNLSRVDEFVGSVVANGSGSWSLSCPSVNCENTPDENVRVTANQTDVDGNTSELSTARIASTPPETLIDGGPADGALINDPNPTYDFSSDEAGSSFECRFDLAAFAACSGPGASHTPPVPLSDGPHTFAVRAVDTVVMTDPTPATRTVTIDTAEPTTTIGGSDGAITSDTTPTFTFNTNEPASFECRFDTNSFLPCNSPHTPATPLADGSHTLHVRATDLAGNVESPGPSRTFTVDTTPPQTAIGSTAPAEGSTTGDSTPALDFSADETSTFECRFDGDAFAACTSPHTPSAPLADGAHTFDVRATDQAGNTDGSPATRSFNVDATAPQTTIGPAAPAEGSTIGDTTPTFDFSANETSTFECRVDGAAFAACSGPGDTHTPAAALSDGAHTFEVRATDPFGNVDASPASRSFTVDTSRTISLEASKSKVKKGKKVGLSGALDAPHADGCEANQEVDLQRGKSAGALQTFATVQTDANGSYSTKVPVKKTLLYRAVVAAGDGCSEAESDTEKVKVKKPKS